MGFFTGYYNGDGPEAVESRNPTPSDWTGQNRIGKNYCLENLEILPMTGFQPQTSGIGNSLSANLGTTTGHN